MKGDFIKGTLGLPSVCMSVCLSVSQSVSPSVHKIGSRDNAKSTENIFMKLDIWINGSMEIMHVFFFSSYVEILVAQQIN
jgi:hypothetical protein